MKKDTFLNMCAGLGSFSEQPGVVASSWTNHFSCSPTLFLLLPDSVRGQMHHPLYPHTAAVLGSSHEDTGRIAYALISRTLNSSLSTKVSAPDPTGVLCSATDPTPGALLAGSLTKWMVWMQPSEILVFWRVGRKTLAWASLSTERSNAAH